jgi:hypothetical protein
VPVNFGLALVLSGSVSHQNLSDRKYVVLWVVVSFVGGPVGGECLQAIYSSPFSSQLSSLWNTTLFGRLDHTARCERTRALGIRIFDKSMEILAEV